MRLFSRLALALALFALALVAVPAFAEEAPKTSIAFGADGLFYQVTNPGMVNAINRIAGNENMPGAAKIQAFTSVVIAAEQSGGLVEVFPTCDDNVFAVNMEAMVISVYPYCHPYGWRFGTIAGFKVREY